jgi:hypothetical protein
MDDFRSGTKQNLFTNVCGGKGTWKINSQLTTQVSLDALLESLQRRQAALCLHQIGLRYRALPFPNEKT